MNMIAADALAVQPEIESAPALSVAPVHGDVWLKTYAECWESVNQAEREFVGVAALAGREGRMVTPPRPLGEMVAAHRQWQVANGQVVDLDAEFIIDVIDRAGDEWEAKDAPDESDEIAADESDVSDDVSDDSTPSTGGFWTLDLVGYLQSQAAQHQAMGTDLGRLIAGMYRTLLVEAQGVGAKTATEVLAAREMEEARREEFERTYEARYADYDSHIAAGAY